MKRKITGLNTEALKSKDSFSRGVYTLLISAITNEEIVKKRELTDLEIQGVVSKELKKREQSVDAYKKANRSDLVELEMKEANLLKELLPAPLTEMELIALISKIKSENKDIHPGKLLGMVNKEVAGRNSIQEIQALL